MARVSLLTAKSETGFQSFILAIHHCEMNQDEYTIKPQTRYFERISGMQSVQKYSRISTWPQHILNCNLPPLEKDRKSEQAEGLGSLYS